MQFTLITKKCEKQRKIYDSRATWEFLGFLVSYFRILKLISVGNLEILPEFCFEAEELQHEALAAWKCWLIVCPEGQWSEARKIFKMTSDHSDWVHRTIPQRDPETQCLTSCISQNGSSKLYLVILGKVTP